MILNLVLLILAIICIDIIGDVCYLAVMDVSINKGDSAKIYSFTLVLGSV